MARIRKREGANGETTFNIMIRKKGVDICKTFRSEEDAKLYVFYKERLIDNMENFEVPIEKRITLRQIYDLKLKEVPESNKRLMDELNNSFERIYKFLPEKMFVHEYSLEDWVNAAKSLWETKVWRGSKNNLIHMSTPTLRRIFANASSAISHAQGLGIPLENHPLKVIQTFISEKIKAT